MGIGAILSNDKVLETGVNILVSVLAFLVLFFGFPTENSIVMELPFETAFPANASFCTSDSFDKTKTEKGVIETTSVYASIGFTSKLVYPTTWTEDNSTGRCPELYPTSLGRGDIVAGGWGPDAEDEAARVEYIKLFTTEQVDIVKAMSNKKVKGVGTEVWTIEKIEDPTGEYAQQFDTCVTATTTIDGAKYDWYFYNGVCTRALYIYGRNSVIVQESIKLACNFPDISNGFTGDLGVLENLDSFKKLFKQSIVECTAIENADPNKVFGIALGYGALVAGAVLAAKSAMMKARDGMKNLKKGGGKELGSMILKSDGDGN